MKPIVLIRAARLTDELHGITHLSLPLKSIMRGARPESNILGDCGAAYGSRQSPFAAGSQRLAAGTVPKSVEQSAKYVLGNMGKKYCPTFPKPLIFLHWGTIRGSARVPVRLSIRAAHHIGRDIPDGRGGSGSRAVRLYFQDTLVEFRAAQICLR